MQINRKAITFLTALFAIFISAAAQDKGKATYYADYFHGKKASDGTLYHRDSMTCAHKSYPFGTLLRVRNVKNGKEVYVTVTDRGPFSRGCIVDLSRAAAEQLEMIADGIATVEVDTVEPVAPFRTIENAILPSLDLEAATSGSEFPLELNNPKMEKRLKDKTARIAVPKSKKAEEPRYRIRRDILSAQSK